MHPVLFRIGEFSIHTYGVLVALGFVVGLLVAARRASVVGLRSEVVSNLGVWLIVAGLAGAKLLHLLLYFEEARADWQQMGLQSLRQGFVFYGGFLGAAVATVVYARLKQVPLWPLADVLAPSVALGHAIGRLGCFANGCCYGKACPPLAWAVRYPSPHPMAGVPVHPTQLYEAAGNLVLFVGLSWGLYRRKSAGQIWWLYVLGYALLRFVVELFRGDYAQRYLLGLTQGQLVALPLGIVAAVCLLRQSRRKA